MVDKATVSEKLTKLAENSAKLYGAGETAGRQAERDNYWDIRQNYGKRTDYRYAFCCEQVLGEWFHPKYDICPTKSATWFMREFGVWNLDGTQNNTAIIDLAEKLKEWGIKMDFSQCRDVTYLFYQARISHLPEINITGAVTGVGEPMFGGIITTIDKLIVNENIVLTNTFGYGTNITNVVIDGVIALDVGSVKNIDLTACTKLTHESLMSFIEHLKDYSGSGNTYTLSMGATNLAKLSDAEKAIATQKGWTLA